MPIRLRRICEQDIPVDILILHLMSISQTEYRGQTRAFGARGSWNETIKVGGALGVALTRLAPLLKPVLVYLDHLAIPSRGGCPAH